LIAKLLATATPLTAPHIFFFSFFILGREDEGPVVELDLACGVFDLKDETAIAAAERSLINQGVAVEKFSGGSDSSDSDSSSSSDGSDNDEERCSDIEDKTEAGPPNLDKKQSKKKGKKPPRHHPGIEEIS
jgi:hypothetical protein